uniref:Guanylate cyclase activator 2B n=1 Tax=Amphiprion percula TaxID=161767 RepID=A0A3P8TX21_AMPPE
MQDAVVWIVLEFLFLKQVLLQVEGRRFPLEAVKQLKKLFNLDEKIPELTKKDVEDVCANRDLPQVFKSVCQMNHYACILFFFFSLLCFPVRIPLDVCEICSFAACTGFRMEAATC